MIQIAVTAIGLGIVGFCAAMMAAQLIEAMATIKPHEVFPPSAGSSLFPSADQLAGRSENGRPASFIVDAEDGSQ